MQLHIIVRIKIHKKHIEKNFFVMIFLLFLHQKNTSQKACERYYSIVNKFMQVKVKKELPLVTDTRTLRGALVPEGGGMRGCYF